MLRTCPGPASLLTALLVAMAACRVEPILELDEPEPSPRGQELEPVAPRVPDALHIVPEAEELQRRFHPALEALARAGAELAYPGSRELEAARVFVVDAVAGAGLQPAAPNGGWQQPVPVRVVRNESAATATVGLPPNDAAIGAVTIERRRPTPPIEHSFAVVDAGYGLVLPERGLNGFEGAAGAVALVREGVPPELAAGVPAVAGTRRSKLESAKRAGVAGVLFATEDAADSPQWNERVAASAVPLVLDPGETSVDAGLEFEGYASKELVAAMSVAGAVGRLRTELRGSSKAVRVHNVVGRIVGADAPEQSVVVVAEMGAPGQGDLSPAALLVALAERSARWAKSGRRPRRSIVFAWTTAGLHGIHALASDGLTAPTRVPLVIDLTGTEERVPSVAGGARDKLAALGWGASPASTAGHAEADGRRAQLEAAGFDAATVSLPVRRQGGGVGSGASVSDTRATAVAARELLAEVWRLADEPEQAGPGTKAAAVVVTRPQ